jgi:quercetin dioxygenase-like cupin family protein
MNATLKTKTGMSRGAEQQTFMVLGVLLQFLSTPEQSNDQISVMRGTIPSGVVIPLHSHADPEIFYVLNSSLVVSQAEGPSEGWQNSECLRGSFYLRKCQARTPKYFS